MKKVLFCALTLALVLTAATVSVFAAGHGRAQGAGTGVCSGMVANCRYTDQDGDGVCDYLGTNCHYTDADGNGICDYFGTGCGGQGNGFTDKNGDGVCDHRSDSRPMDGSGWGYHGGRHN